MKKSASKRFWEKVKTYSDERVCWFWLGGVDKDGYGWFWFQGTTVKAHRFSYFLAQPTWNLKSKDFILHTCDRPACVNPDHLWVGTAVDNMRDRDRKGRGASGSQTISTPKLSAKEVRKIRKDTRFQWQIALDYGVTQTAISKIKRGKTWKHVR